ncbi:hypothetical protein LEW33_002745, partial [Salmonella enterica]|nr:hypothetical protein [Salmonella enterica]ECY7694486.1 hypothetical protein [Salmonella enterica subsp. enterica serovar Montevideo]EBA8748292.1 hypothetical protein [Salmonella enterica]EFS8412362.1 hypothetical protein [Salmonella enterica]EIE6125699.1 hypothetical protein [Salmonella enterica]
AYKFYDTFHEYGFSTKNQDWANAGSFFGGIYSAIFTFISLIVLSATLILTKKYNNQQLEILLTSQRRTIFCSLFDKLTQKMDSIEYYKMGLNNEEHFFSMCETELFNDLHSIKEDGEWDAGDVIDLSVNLLQGDWFNINKPYYDVILITEEILNILDDAPEDDKRFFLAYMEANASTQRLYWLFCYMYAFRDNCSDILVRNTRTLRIPKGYV